MRTPAAAPVQWWVVETLELGRTAMPGRVLAYQGAETCRGLHLKVLSVRPASPLDAGDRLAVKQSREELHEMQLRAAQLAGVFGRRNLRHV